MADEVERTQAAPDPYNEFNAETGYTARRHKHPDADHEEHDRAIEQAAVKAALEGHEPRITGDVDDSTWLMCDCGWDQMKANEPWGEHIDARLADLT